jgi:hypothetical protein
MENQERRNSPWPWWIWLVVILFPLPLRRGHWLLGLVCFVAFVLLLIAVRHLSE